jgi:hypothetical protein
VLLPSRVSNSSGENVLLLERQPDHAGRVLDAARASQLVQPREHEARRPGEDGGAGGSRAAG